MRTLAEISAAVQANPGFRKSLGREALWQACAACELRACNPKAAGCLARRARAERFAAYHATHHAERLAYHRDYYRANREAHREKSRRYEREARDEINTKRRAAHARAMAAAGRSVRPYTWRNPQKNKPAPPVQEA